MPMIRATLYAALSASLLLALLPPAHAQRSGNIGGCDIRRGTLCTNLNLNGANLEGVNLANSQFTRSDLSGANLRGATLNEANFSQAEMAGATLDGASMLRTNLRGARLTGDQQIVHTRLGISTKHRQSQPGIS